MRQQVLQRPLISHQTLEDKQRMYPQLILISQKYERRFSEIFCHHWRRWNENVLHQKRQRRSALQHGPKTIAAVERRRLATLEEVLQDQRLSSAPATPPVVRRWEVSSERNPASAVKLSSTPARSLVPVASQLRSHQPCHEYQELHGQP
jgi:hypothetical protein